MGLAGLVHDVGKARIPGEVLRKPEGLMEEEQEHVRRHTLYGARALREAPGFNALAMVATFEHHAGYDLSGYPRITLRPRPHLVSRIVQVGDVFDAATSSRRAYRTPQRGRATGCRCCWRAPAAPSIRSLPRCSSGRWRGTGAAGSAPTASRQPRAWAAPPGLGPRRACRLLRPVAYDRHRSSHRRLARAVRAVEVVW